MFSRRRREHPLHFREKPIVQRAFPLFFFVGAPHSLQRRQRCLSRCRILSLGLLRFQSIIREKEHTTCNKTHMHRSRCSVTRRELRVDRLLRIIALIIAFLLLSFFSPATYSKFEFRQHFLSPSPVPCDAFLFLNDSFSPSPFLPTPFCTHLYLHPPYEHRVFDAHAARQSCLVACGYVHSLAMPSFLTSARTTL